MKMYAFAAVLLVPSLLVARSIVNHTAAKSAHYGRDTIFLKKRLSPNDNIIFIEKNRESVFYRKLLDFNLDALDSNQYAQSRAELAQSVKHFIKHKLPELPGQWLPVNRYKQNYYLYYPADLGVAGRKMITDSTICSSHMDGIDPQAVMSVLKKDRYTWDFKVKSLAVGVYHIIIHIIDRKTKLAVWEEFDEKQPRYELYVPVEYAKNFDMIVNYTDGDLPDEFEFDKIDFKAILKGHK